MKKILSFILGVVLFITSVAAVDSNINGAYDKKLNDIDRSWNYNGGLDKMKYPETIGQALNKDTVVMLGSSELSYYDEKSHPAILTDNGNSDFNIMQVGIGSIQSLPHAINIGGIEPYIENKMVVINLSPQWFSETGLRNDAFASRFSPAMLEAFMKNDKISMESKKKVLNRCKELLAGYSYGEDLVADYEKKVAGRYTPVDKLCAWIKNKFADIKFKKSMIDDLQITSQGTDEPVIFSEIDFQRLKNEAEEQGKAECTNNKFYIYDDYYDTYLKDDILELKNSNVNTSYCSSPEYDDLRLLLKICNELELKVLLISIPVNGYWYDYTGFPKEDREKYYQNIREIADEYEVELLDLSTHEYEPYFLKDVMHLGWKGWAYVVEGIYGFYKKNVE